MLISVSCASAVQQSEVLLDGEARLWKSRQ